MTIAQDHSARNPSLDSGPEHISTILGRSLAAALVVALQDPILRAELERLREPARSTDPQRLTRQEYALRERVSLATVSRWVKAGMPVVPVGSTDRIDVAEADAWRRARGRVPTKSSSPTDNVDVSTIASMAGLRAVAGGRGR